MKSNDMPIKIQFWLWVISIFPALLFFGFYWYSFQNVPFRDDIGAILKPLNQLLNTNNWSAKYLALTQQHDERRIIISRLVSWGILTINGQVDFGWLRAIGFVVLAGIALICFGISQKINKNLWIYLPIPYLLFQLQYHEGFFYAVVPTQYFMVICLAFCSIYSLLYAKQMSWVVALLIATLATAADTVGIFVFGVCLGLLLFQKKYVPFLVGLVVALTVGFFYFRGFSIPAYRPSITQNLIKFPHLIVADFFSLVGGYFDPGPDFSLLFRGILTIGTGIVSIAWFGYCFFKLFQTARQKDVSLRTNATWALSNNWLMLGGVLMFLLLTIAAFSGARAGDGFEAVLLSRYKLIGTMIVILSYLSVCIVLSPKLQKGISLLTASLATLLLILSYYYHATRVLAHQKDLMVDAYSWKNCHTMPSSPVYLMVKNQVDDIIIKSEKASIYQFPTPFPNLAQQPTKAKISEAFGVSDTKDFYFLIPNEVFENVAKKYNGDIYILLASNKARHLFPAYQVRNSFFQMLRTGAYLSNRFTIPGILKMSLPPNTYEIQVLAQQGTHFFVIPTQQHITI